MFSPEVDWQMSVWPICERNNHDSQSTNFQYKIKNETLLTPAMRYYENITTTNIPKPQNPMCPVCNNENEEADITHIFGNCRVATQQNKLLWENIVSMLPQVIDKPWFTIDNNNLKRDNLWDKQLGNIGYIPKSVSELLTTAELKETLPRLVKESKQTIWTEYWKCYVETLKNKNTDNNSNILPTQENALPPKDSSPPQVAEELVVTQKKEEGCSYLFGNWTIWEETQTDQPKNQDVHQQTITNYPLKTKELTQNK